ncbi:class IV adenylate cyclase [Candidatus Saccharibacteria bacterium]|nr:class IV adenylate cyclase [Candidatus Saccharibacteria bacterium]
MKYLNVEIKARCRNQKNIRALLESKKADFKGLDHQVDTYFKVKQGRLKLREGNIENALIFYERNNKTGPKKSKTTLFKLNSGSSLKEILIKFLEVLVIVDKQREIYFISNVKFHIDTVKGLGTFIEIEAIDKNGIIGSKELHEQCQFYLDLLKIREKDLIPHSYSDLLLSL